MVAHQSDIVFEPEVWLHERDMTVVHWRASFLWRPIGARVELDAVMRLMFVSGETDNLLCTRFEEWIEIRDAAPLGTPGVALAAEPA